MPTEPKPLSKSRLAEINAGLRGECHEYGGRVRLGYKNIAQQVRADISWLVSENRDLEERLEAAERRGCECGEDEACRYVRERDAAELRLIEAERLLRVLREVLLDEGVGGVALITDIEALLAPQSPEHAF